MHEIAADTESWRASLAFALVAPRFGIPYLHAIWLKKKFAPRLKAFSDAPPDRKSATFLVLLALHPFATVRRVLPHIRISWISKNQSSPNPAEELPGRPIDDAAETGTNEVDDELSVLEMLAEAEQAYLDRQIVSVAIRENDAYLFGGPDRDEDGFVRLMLRESYHDFVLPGSNERHHVVFEPRLLLHEAGIVQIDLVLSAHTALDVRQALAMMWGPEEIFVRSEMSRPLLKGTRWESRADYSDNRLDAGQPLGVIEHTTPASMRDLADVHLTATLAVIKNSYKHWVIYPVAILDPDECCAPEDWKRNHRDDLIRLAIRGSVDLEVAPHVPMPRDLSLSQNRSLFAGLGSAVLFQWTGKAPRGIAELDTALVLEYAQLQYLRIHTMEQLVSEMNLNERSLRARYRGAVRIFSELRQRDLRAGEARDIVRHVLKDLGAPEIRQTIETALSLSASAYATLSAERASRRAWWITAAATLLAFLVAVPSISELLASAPAPGRGEISALVPFRWLAEQGFWGPWIMMAGVLTVVVFFWTLGALRRCWPNRMPSSRRGFKWPNEFMISESNHSPSTSGPRTTKYRVTMSNKVKGAQAVSGLPLDGQLPVSADQNDMPDQA